MMDCLVRERWREFMGPMMGTLTGSRMVDNQTSTSICEISPTRSKSRAGKKVKR